MTSQYRQLGNQLLSFIIHLRWHYQLGILSGGYLLAGLFLESINIGAYLIQFINVHLLLFGGATAYNSYMDKDEGPVGGLKNPPPMNEWMHPASLAIQFIGLVIASNQGDLFFGLYLLSMLMFWLYSSPRARWKGKPVLSIIAIAISTGTNSFLMGYLAGSQATIPGYPVVVAAVGVALMLVSLYPISQWFQLEVDTDRGDLTFALKYGKKGIIIFFAICFLTGTLITGVALIQMVSGILGVIFLLMGAFIGFKIINILQNLEGSHGEYDKVMNIKYFTSFSFVAFILIAVIIKHYVAWPI